MQVKTVAPSRVARKPRGIVAVTGHGVRLRVWLHSLWIDDGFKSDGEGRQRSVHRATMPVERILLLAGSGNITLDALDWAADNGAPVIACDQRGRLRWTLLPGEGGNWRTSLQRLQALAPQRPVGIEVARYLITTKVRGQAALLRELSRRQQGRTEQASSSGAFLSAAEVLSERFLPMIEEPRANIQRLVFVESQAADVYFSAFSGITLQFAPASYAERIPPFWRAFGGRHSPFSNGARRAVTPLNALLNFAYALLEGETRIACHAAGFSPTMGVFHTDKDARLSWIYDLMEPCRPGADRCVLELALRHTFRPGELWALNDGTCRLDQDFAAHLAAQWLPLFRREVAPVAERVASILRHGRTTALQSPTDTAARHSAGICPECGSPVRPGRRFCSAACYQVFWRAKMQRSISHQGNETLARLRADGRDPRQTLEVTQRRVASYVATRRRQRLAMPPDREREELNGALRKAIRDAKQVLSLGDLARALHLSQHTTHALVYADDYNAGHRVASLIAESCAELLRASSTSMPSKILQRLHRSARAVASCPAQVWKDDRGRFMKGWKQGDGPVK